MTVECPNAMLARNYENMSLPDFLRWRVVLLRTLAITLLAPPGTDFVFHVPGDIRSMQENMMPSSFALQMICETLWRQRE